MPYANAVRVLLDLRRDSAQKIANFFPRIERLLKCAAY